MDADGTKAGFDLELIGAVRQVVDVPVIASGGAGAVADFPPAVAAGADAVLAASVFHFGELTHRRGQDRPARRRTPRPPVATRRSVRPAARGERRGLGTVDRAETPAPRRRAPPRRGPSRSCRERSAGSTPPCTVSTALASAAVRAGAPELLAGRGHPEPAVRHVDQPGTGEPAYGCLDLVPAGDGVVEVISGGEHVGQAYALRPSGCRRASVPPGAARRSPAIRRSRRPPNANPLPPWGNDAV